MHRLVSLIPIGLAVRTLFAKRLNDLAPFGHGSSEGHEMLKRNDKYHSIADDVPIPKMTFLSKSVDGLFKKLHFCV